MYEVSYSSNGKVLECFSKKYDDPFNANEHFAAMMSWSPADEACPLIQGADLRVPIPYVDPKNQMVETRKRPPTMSDANRLPRRCFI